MNHLPIRAEGAGAPLMTRRQLAKQKTRMKLLDAARELFADRGYEAATVRDIAAAANLSTGAVFASFSDKADLFSEVIMADYERLHDMMAAVPSNDGSVRDSLLSLLTLAYETHLDRLRLVQAVLSFSWTRDIRADHGNRPGVRLVMDDLTGVIQRGVETGELSPEINARLTAEMLWDCYVSNYRRAIFDGWDRDALRARLADQIDVLLCVHRKAA